MTKLQRRQEIRRRIRSALTIAALLGAIPTANAAEKDSTTMYYGIGTATCAHALREDWLKNGEMAWVSGYMSAVSAFSKDGPDGTSDILPSGTPAILAKLVLKECQHDPRLMLGEAASNVAARLLKQQTDSSVIQQF